MENIKKNKRIFSHALFKQSCKANGIMWAIITAAVCFMLACVMLISGTSNISSVKDGVQDTIIQEIIKSEIKKATVNIYDSSLSGETEFDKAFASKFDELNTLENAMKLNAIKTKAEADATALVTEKVTEYVTAEVTSRITAEITERVQGEAEEIKAEVTAAVVSDLTSDEGKAKIATHMAEGDDLATATAKTKDEYVALETAKITNEHVATATADLTTDAHKAEVTNQVLADNQSTYKAQAMQELSSELQSIKNQATLDSTEKFKELYIVPSYTYAAEQIGVKYNQLSQDYKVAMLTINPNGAANSQYELYKEEIPEEYILKFTSYMQADVEAWNDGAKGTSLDNYILTQERDTFKKSRAIYADSMVVAGKMTSAEYKQEIVNILSDFKVSEQEYDEMGFDYKEVHKIAYEGIQEFQNKYDYEISLISDDIKSDEAKYNAEEKRIHDDIYLAVAGSLLDKLPENVSDGIKELGTMDLYGLIVGSIFFKMAGLLLPIIYVIMVSNSLIAGQVDTGSMAYVLSTSTRRKEVTFTQSLYLIGSLFLMICCTTITSIICFNIANVTTDLTIGKLLLINLGAFITLFAISGINFATSCYFDRSKKAMALGGGVSMFFLVCTMLGLFGSPVIPSVVRISALNNFNYVSLISLFDVVSMLKGETAWIYKLVILLAVGIVGYVAGSIKFKKKDLPL